MKHENMDAHLIGQASWICPTELVSVPTFTKRFRIGKRPRSATLAITGLGYFEFTINGESITDERLIPPASDYFQREFKEVTYPVIDAFTHRIYYHTYPIEKYLHEGENILEVTCGGGFFVQKERVAEGKMHYADVPMCLFAIDTGDDVILSDGSESWRENEIRTSRLFIGETIDYTFVGAEERPVRTLPHPDTILSPAIGSMDKIKRTIKPKLLSEGEVSRIYDIGENVSALVSLTTNAPFGARYTLRFAENINACGALDFHSTGAVYKGTSGELQIMQDIFITDGKRRTFLPHFTWHAFRYFEVAGDLDAIEDVTVCVIHADVNPKCTFSSDSEGLNFLYDAYLRTTLSNYHGSYPSDCPHRERLGYTGDGQITARSAMMMLDTKDLYRKWIQDILDSQDKNTGHVQHTAPFQGGGGGPGGWGSAIVTVPYAFAKEYGFDDILLTARPAMYRWLAFTKDCTERGLVVREREGGWCLGDWCALPEAVLPEPFVNTCWFVHAIRLYRELSCFLSHTPEEELDI
ncbi:MAG: family 78 glycoside hydrolase catalytic domain [Clostridia bacterium]|nr:family 78 glycoside hydrolase catalytic domain [Clostridia bacterium]